MDYATALDLSIRSFHLNGVSPDHGPAERPVPTTLALTDRADAFYAAGKAAD